MVSTSSEADYRVLLIGKTGDGKSSTGNTIVGADVFEVGGPSESCTATCRWSKTCSRLGKIVEVVDTPGLFDTKLKGNEVSKELFKALFLTTPGFHAIAFVLKRGTKLTEEVQKIKELFFQWFGPGVEKFACLILTDTASKEEMEEYIIKNPHKVLSDLVMSCNSNIIPINNKASEETKDQQVKNLFDVLENIKKNNKYEHFSNIGFHLAEEYIKNKYPQGLTENTIRLLGKLNDDEEICRNYDKMMSIAEGETAHEAPCDDDSDTEANASVAVGGIGHLTIIDSSTNERIPKRNRENKTIRNSPELQVRRKQTCSYQTFDEKFSVSGRRGTRTDRKVYQGDNFAYSSDYERQTECSQTYQTTGFNIQEKKSKIKPKTRKGRIVDITTVSFEIPTSGIDEFKCLINDDEDGEKLHGFTGYMKKAWRWCKERPSRCTIL